MAKKVIGINNYKILKTLNNNKQMHDIWTFLAIAHLEKLCGKYPAKTIKISCVPNFND